MTPEEQKAFDGSFIGHRAKLAAELAEVNRQIEAAIPPSGLGHALGWTILWALRMAARLRGLFDRR